MWKKSPLQFNRKKILRKNETLNVRGGPNASVSVRTTELHTANEHL